MTNGLQHPTVDRDNINERPASDTAHCAPHGPHVMRTRDSSYNSGHLAEAHAPVTAGNHVPDGRPDRCNDEARMSRLGLFLFAVMLTLTAVGCEDCQPCEDPSQLICSD